MFHISFSVKNKTNKNPVYLNCYCLNTTIFDVYEPFCRRCMLKTSNHAGVEGFIVKNIRNQVEISLQVRQRLTD